eukprot:TRINITY_DN47663_c0_g1_i1.p1 TRINITY_DN47663_c0_g1~~TRINITY_DN47663_c0_g1_i1.p1  ORF type:complete len:312 (-),score=49.82 TRINITY_DN47663_c0_g1_i1:40-975(-)
MSGRVFFTPQAGRSDRSRQVDEEPWGTTSSQSHFKAYEASEARSARSGPSHLKPCLEAPSKPDSRLSTGRRSLHIWERHREHYADPSSASQASAVTASQTSAGSKQGAGRRSYIPAADLVAMRPIPERPFVGTSHYDETQAEAQQARHDYFPHRDEFHPRSKRLLYEMALDKVVRGNGSEAGSVASGASRSCFTVASTAASGKSAASSMSRSSSVPGLPSSSSSRLPTGDSLRVSGGAIGSLATRRKEAFYRAPAQWAADREWYNEKFKADGPAGLSTANAPAAEYANSLDKYGQVISKVSAMMEGVAETK